ncbi:MAG TPA: ABC transporter ATP-binding protein [Patescibacteria group bacterium]|nr:ABC transporter ATP-binding protein [Patescibacteria group bacterium]
MNATDVITVQNLTKTYVKNRKQKPVLAVAGISFAVRRGEIFGILGPNGAGKTTTLEILEGLKPQTSGEISVLGLNNLTQTDQLKKRIGVQLQSSEYLHHLSLGELLDLFASLYGRQADRAALLNLVNLADKETAEVSSLSGGQKQRFTIASALVHQPDILFLDEPTTGLDPAARRSLWALVKTINSRGITVVLTTHYMEEAEYLCHRVAIMDQGKILEIDEPKKLIDRLSDTTQVSFFTDQQLAPDLFAGLSEVTKILASHPKVVMEISSLEKIGDIVRRLRQQQIIFYGFTVKTATLEDVYLRLTGREYEEGEDHA